MLTTTQYSTLKADIAANSDLNVHPNNADGNAAIAAVYGLTASPDYWVWRTFVPDAELYEATSPDATTWSWTTFIARSQGERDAWRQMVNMAGGLNPSLANTRAGIADIFSGAGGAGQRAHLLAMARRLARRSEQLFATGLGTTGAPSLMAVEGLLSPDDIQIARNLP